jgi:dihydropteroate synthase
MTGPTASTPERILFVTGKLAEPALRRVLAELAPRVGFVPEVAVLPITVAALLTTDWVARHLRVPAGVSRIVLPGFCRGPSEPLERLGVPVVRGPKDLRDLPEFFGKGKTAPADYGAFDLEIIAEINHAPSMSPEAILARAQQYHADGADVIDLGCDPGGTWTGLAEAVGLLRAAGLRVSVDSLNPDEIEAALAAGAELVLSVNSTNLDRAVTWPQRFGNCFEVVAIPDVPATLAGLDRTIQTLADAGVAVRIDPILEPIGFGFAQSLGRYLQIRQRYPDAAMLMGVGNLTELTDVDSAGVNVLLAGFCQEVGIRSVLTTEVINWARTSVRELDLARRLVHYAVTHHVPPKRLEPRLVQLRDPKLYQQGQAAIAELARHVHDRNYRIFAEAGQLHLLNGQMYLTGDNPFALFAEVLARDTRMDAAHAFYLGYEMAKAVVALTLHKNYVQDQPLNWGLLTRPEPTARPPRDHPAGSGDTGDSGDSAPGQS